MPTKPKVILESGGVERLHWKHLFALIESTTGPVRVASAYVTDRDFYIACGKRKRQLLTSLNPMDVASGATSLEALRSLIESSVEIRVLPGYPRFHAKTYIFGNSAAVITSANLTRSALQSNIEVGVELANGEISSLIDWFDTFWKSADRLTIAELSKIHEQTKKLRREYVKLKKQAKTKLKAKATKKAKQTNAITEILGSAKSFFLVNTNRRYDYRTATGGYGLEEKMMERGFATVWESFNYPSHMERVRRGDVILAFAKGVGIIGVGVAKSKCKVLDENAKGRIRSVDVYNTAEWRVPTDWLIWVDEADALPYSTPPNASFVDISGEHYSELRQEVADHFLDWSAS